MADPKRLAIALIGFSAFIDLYPTQSLLPLFAREFAGSPAAVSLTVSATTLAVALVAPFIGVVADVVGRKRVIIGAIFALVLPTLLAASATSLTELVIWRFLQGLLLPPIFAVAVAYIGEEWPRGEVAGVTGLYVAGTGLGGFLGRFVAGFMAGAMSWRAAFVALALINLACGIAASLLLPRERGFVAAAGLRTSLGLMARHLLEPRVVATFAVGFAVLFSFVAIFTYVNFYLAAPPFELSPAALGSIFVVYLVGVAVTPLSGRWIGKFGRRRLIAATVGVWCIGLLLTLIPALPAILAGLALSAACGFISQAAATGFLAATATAARSSAVGLYVTCYYLGGSLGAVLPGLAWNAWGWPGCLGLVIAVLILMMLLVARAWREPD